MQYILASEETGRIKETLCGQLALKHTTWSEQQNQKFVFSQEKG